MIEIDLRSEKITIPKRIGRAASSSSLLARGRPSRILENNTPYTIRRVIRMDAAHNAAVFHRGALGDFRGISNSELASARKITAISRTG